MIQAKAILPKPIKLEAFKAEDDLRQVGNKIKLDFEKTTKTWDHKVLFEVLVHVSQDESTKSSYVFVGTGDQIYIWVSEGTEGPYPIPKTGTTLLAFPGGYVAKTVPGNRFSFPGGSYGTTVFAMHVMHPGIKPRDFVALITRVWEVKFAEQMQGYIIRAVKESGHAIS